jgi:hypothetical protein
LTCTCRFLTSGHIYVKYIPRWGHFHLHEGNRHRHDPHKIGMYRYLFDWRRYVRSQSNRNACNGNKSPMKPGTRFSAKSHGDGHAECLSAQLCTCRATQGPPRGKRKARTEQKNLGLSRSPWYVYIYYAIYSGVGNYLL